jgi:hypothetical protein
MLKFLAGHDLNHLAQLDKIAAMPRQIPQKTQLFGPKPTAQAPAKPAAQAPTKPAAQAPTKPTTPGRTKKPKK